MSTASPPDVSVVVALRNSATTVPLLLDALDRQTLDPERWELVMVDDASTDETPALIARHGRARLVRSETHVGLPAGRNLGIRAAKAAVVALTDGDTVPDPTWLERGLGRFADPGVDILAGGITIPAGASPTVASLLDAAAFLDQERYVLRGFGAGANLWLRREVFGRAGPFEERLAAYGGDEEEFCARARAHGASVVYAPEVHLVHPPRRRLRQVASKSYRLGFGLAFHRRLGTSPLSAHPREFLRIKSVTPRRRIHRLDRVIQQYHPTVRELAALYAAQYFCLQIPRALGDLRGELAARARGEV